jgi:DNA-binding PadR family transcriptional regulator
MNVSLTPLTYEILLVLAGRIGHGYGTLKEIESHGGPVPSTGAMYMALHRMVDDGLLEEVPAPPGAEDKRRRYYRVTASGQRAAREESRRLERLVNRARAKNLLVGGTT